MSECYLLCNIVKCRKELNTQAWVTLCSHIFCMNHGQNALDKGKCSVCDTAFSNKFDIVIMDLNPPEHHKTMVLAGLSPEKVLDIANRSLTIWTYQIYQERLLRISELRTAKQHSAEIADYCESIIAKHKVELQKLHRELQCYEKTIEEKSKQNEDFAMQLAEKNKLIKNLQSQNDSLKRTLANYTRSREHYDQAEDMDQDAMIRSCNSNYSYNRLTNKDRPNYEYYSSETPNQDFVFKPVTTPNFSDKYTYKFK